MFGKLKEIIGLGEYDEEFDELEETEEEQSEIEPIIQNTHGTKVVNIHSNNTAKIMVVKPTAYEESREIAEAVKSRKIVVINTNSLETEIAQRLVDLVSGAACVLNAELQEIEQRVYLLSPQNVLQCFGKKKKPFLPPITGTKGRKQRFSAVPPVFSA